MGIPLKENLIYFENLAKNQTRVYPDACDHGIILHKHNGVKEQARKNIVELIDFYGAKITKCSYYPKNTTTQIFLPIEYDNGGVSGIILEVSYYEDRSRKIEFLSIQFNREVLSKTETKNKYNCKVFN